MSVPDSFADLPLLGDEEAPPAVPEEDPLAGLDALDT